MRKGLKYKLKKSLRIVLRNKSGPPEVHPIYGILRPKFVVLK